MTLASVVQRLRDYTLTVIKDLSTCAIFDCKYFSRRMKMIVFVVLCSDAKREKDGRMDTLQPFLFADLINAFTIMTGSMVPSPGEYIAAANALSSTRGNFFFASAGSIMCASIPKFLQAVINLSYSATRSYSGNIHVVRKTKGNEGAGRTKDAYSLTGE